MTREQGSWFGRLLLLPVLVCGACESETPATMSPVATAPAGGTTAAPIPSAAGSTASAAGTRASGPVVGAAGRAPVLAAGSTGSSVGDVSTGGVGAVGTAGATAAAAGGTAVAVAGSGGAATSTAGAGGGAGPTAGAGSPTHEDLGKGDGKDVIAIGDSWMLLTGTGIQTGLLKASKQPYRVYGVPGTQLLNGQIPGQYDDAKREDPDIKTVVMTGGGNDLLLTGMTGAGADGQIAKVAEGLVKIWNQMGADGVKDIVYIEYSRGGTNEKNVNTGTAMIQPLCAKIEPARCHWIDSDETIMMQLRDGIHPTDAGFDALGKTVFALMEKEGMRR
jgi:hypothetical protein